MPRARNPTNLRPQPRMDPVQALRDQLAAVRREGEARAAAAQAEAAAKALLREKMAGALPAATQFARAMQRLD